MRLTKTDRLIAECVFMSMKREFTHADISAEFDISRSTSYNDLRFLREYAHVPIAAKTDGTGLYIYGTWSVYSIHLKPEYQEVLIELIHVLETRYKKVLINILSDYGDKKKAEDLRQKYLK